MLSENYGLLDRAIHHLVLGFPGIQKVLAELESDIYRSQIGQFKTEREVFVTGLPRAGTTLLLDLLYSTGEFVTYTYRHMPLVMAPLLWAKMTGSFQQSAISQERAHGDGMEVSVDSPEAFEEIIWLAFMRDQIEQEKVLSPLPADLDVKEFSRVMKTSIRKLMFLDSQSRSASTASRYLSKNNANISRIDVIAKMFPSAIVVAPFRDPFTHIESLATQHKRFLARHQTDRFSRNYMKWLGHYEFGANFKPINFDSWLDSESNSNPNTIDYSFWLSYWIAGYQYLLDRLPGNVLLVDYDQLLQDGNGQLGWMADKLELSDPQNLVCQSARLRPPTSAATSRELVPDELAVRAQNLHAALKEST